MSNYTEKRIEEIRTLVTKEIPAAIDAGISIDEYLTKHRVALNLTIIQAIFGAEFSDPKKEGKDCKVKFNHKLADVSELATISHLLDDFIGDIENPFLSPEFESGNGDDMSIPTCVRSYALPELEKVNNKKVTDYIFGGNAISKMMLTGRDICDLAAVAQKIKKTKVRNTMLLIGGIALVVTGGAVATVCVVNNKKKHNDVDTDTPTVDLDGTDIDVPDVDLDGTSNDDVPRVELD